MGQKFLIVAVLLCLLDVVRPTLFPKMSDVSDTSTENDLYDTLITTTILPPTTTEMPIEYTTQQNGEVDQQGGNWFKSLFGGNANGPSLVVEVNDATNDASLKILHLPLIHYTENKSVSTSETQVPTSNSSTATNTTLPTISRRKRDVDLKIDDFSVIQAMIDALKGVNRQSADFMQDNIDRMEVSVEIDDKDRSDDRLRRSVRKKSEDFKSSTTTAMPNLRRSRAVKFEIFDMNVIKAMIKAIQRVDPKKAKHLQENIELLEVKVEVKDNDIWMDANSRNNVPEQTKSDTEPKKSLPNDTYVSPLYLGHDVEFKIYDINVIKAMISPLKKIDPHQANFLENNIDRVEIKVEVDDDDDDDDDFHWRRNIAKQSEWDLKQRKHGNKQNSRRKRDIDFKIYDRTVIKALIDALQKVDPQKAMFMLDNIDRVEVEVEVEDDDDWINERRLRNNEDQSQRVLTERSDGSYNIDLSRSRRLHDIDFKIYDRTVINALIDALHKVDPQRAKLMKDNLDRLELKVEIEYYDNWIV